MADTRTKGESERFSTAVVEAVAQRVGVEPAGLEPPLYEAVDPDALDELLASLGDEGDGGSVTFPYRGFDVTVHVDGRVVLDGSSGSSSADADSTTTGDPE